jgi:hypothetical protein
MSIDAKEQNRDLMPSPNKSPHSSKSFLGSGKHNEFLDNREFGKERVQVQIIKDNESLDVMKNQN